MLTVPFLTGIDPEAAVKGSRDPLGLQTIWIRLGGLVVGNLTTVSTSVRDFTTLILGYYFAERVALAIQFAATRPPVPALTISAVDETRSGEHSRRCGGRIFQSPIGDSPIISASLSSFCERRLKWGSRLESPYEQSVSVKWENVADAMLIASVQRIRSWIRYIDSVDPKP